MYLSSLVRLGQSGLKVSRIILGCMSYGDPQWQPWVLDEEAGLEHIKAAYDAGINAFDTADMYSRGRSEEILGKAIKLHNLPRDEIVILTKVLFSSILMLFSLMYLNILAVGSRSKGWRSLEPSGERR